MAVDISSVLAVQMIEGLALTSAWWTRRMPLPRLDWRAGRTMGPTSFSGVVLAGGLRVVLSTLVLAVCLVEAQPAVAGWRLQSVPAPRGSVPVLMGVSCTSRTACTAIGSYSLRFVHSTLAERWDGKRWSIQATPNPPLSVVQPYVSLNSVSCPSSSDCMAVGQYTNPAGQATLFSELWNGTDWSIQPVPGGTTGQLEGVSCTSSTACTAVGYGEGTIAVRWNGASWSMQSIPNPPADDIRLFGVSCPSMAMCMTVGRIWPLAHRTRPLSDRWERMTWSFAPAPTPTNGYQNLLSSVSCWSSRECIAVGNFVHGTISDRFVSLAERWDGSRWSIEPTPGAGHESANELDGVSCPSSTMCAAVGFIQTPAFHNVPLTELWNGSTWSIQPSPNPSGSTETEPAAVSCVSREVCTAVGTFSGGDHALAEQTTTGLHLAEAKLTRVPLACARLPYTARITGRYIASVAWTLDGRTIASLTAHRGTRYAATVPISPGRHRLVVTVKFGAYGETWTRTLDRIVLGCRTG